MDFEKNANKPCCSKSLYPPKKYSDEPIVIDEDVSNDSAYETGSALSRSSQSSPISDIQDSKGGVLQDGINRRPKILFYANVYCDPNNISPWQLVSLIKRTYSKKEVAQICDVVEISDSDDEKTFEEPLSKPETSSSSIAAANSSEPEIITIDSDDDDDECTKPMENYVFDCANGEVKIIPHQFIANAAPPDPGFIFEKETRVIAQRKTDGMPARYSKCGLHSTPIYTNKDNAFYAGIISGHISCENGIQKHLVFFDDGHAFYIPNQNIRAVFGDYGRKYVHKNAERFYDYFFNTSSAKQLPEIVPIKNTKLNVFQNGELEEANVLEYYPHECGMVCLDFGKSRIIEWLYVGSPRISVVWKEIIRNKQLERYTAVDTTMVDVSSDSEEEMDFQSPEKHPLSETACDPLLKKVKLDPNELISNYKPYKKLDRRHNCGPKCVKEFEENEEIFRFDPLKRPILAGWTRNVSGLCNYITPCGRSFSSIETTYKYLLKTKSKLTIDCFTFSPQINCMREIRSYSKTGRVDYLNDLIRGGWRETQRIPVISIGKNVPHFSEYVTRYRRNPKSKKVPAILNDFENPFRSGCDCTDDCSDKSKCSCWQLTCGPSKRPTGYKYRRLDGKVDTGIYECNPTCKCSSRCLNRVVSAEIQQKLELFETKDRGYGIRCQMDLPKGTFVSCYFGDLLHGKTADERAMKKIGSSFGDEYFMQLDHIEVAEEYKDGYESDVEIDFLDDIAGTPLKRPKLDESFKRTPRLMANTNGGVLDYFPNIKKKRQQIEVTQRTQLYGENAVEFVVDGRFRGNISRFFNHSCSPNLFSQTVFVDTHDLRFPWSAFFASYDIKAGTELTWDYNYAIGSIEGRQIECKCGAPNCRGRLL